MSLIARTRLSEIVSALGGPKVKRGRCAAWWRGWDDPTAVSVNDEKDVWYDYARGVGGGTLAPIARVRVPLDGSNASCGATRSVGPHALPSAHGGQRETTRLKQRN